MRIHVHSDGSEGREFEIGDTVHASQATAGGWFSDCLRRAPFCTVQSIESGPWRTAGLELRHAPEWGTIRTAPWHCTPTAETLSKAVRVQVAPR